MEDSGDTVIQKRSKDSIDNPKPGLTRSVG